MRLFNRIRSKVGLRPVFRIYVATRGAPVTYKIRAASLEEAIEMAEQRYSNETEGLEIWGGA